MTRESNPSSSRWRTGLDFVATLAVAAAAVSILVRNAGGSGTEPPLPSEPLNLDLSRVAGDKNAKVALIEYGDFLCSSCAMFAANTLPLLRTRWIDAGEVIFEYRPFPLGRVPTSGRAAAAAVCAGQQGQFIVMHDLLFRRPRELDDAMITEYGRKIGRVGDSFERCLDGDDAAQTIKHARDEARRLHVSGTPTFFAGVVDPQGRVRVSYRVVGAKPLAAFQTILEALVDRVR